MVGEGGLSTFLYEAIKTRRFIQTCWRDEAQCYRDDGLLVNKEGGMVLSAVSLQSRSSLVQGSDDVWRLEQHVYRTVLFSAVTPHFQNVSNLYRHC